VTIAERYGFDDPRDLHDHPKNTELKRARPNPTILCPGDVVFVPDRDVAPLSIEVGGRHRFRARRPAVSLKVRLEDEAGEALANRKVRLRWGGRTQDLTTDGDGVLEHRVTPSDASVDAVIWLDPDDPGTDEHAPSTHHVVFRLGHLDPASEVRGVQQRLANLGLVDGAPSGEVDEATRSALAIVQRQAGIADTGELDDATRDALLDRHGGR
jgi:hypothetical protein